MGMSQIKPKNFDNMKQSLYLLFSLVTMTAATNLSASHIADYAKQIPLPDGILILKILLSAISVYAMLFVVTYFKQLPVLKHYRKQGITMIPGVESFPFSNMPAFMAYSKAADTSPIPVRSI